MTDAEFHSLAERYVRESLTPNPGAQMMDLSVRQVWSMFYTGKLAAEKAGATPESVVAELRKQYERAKKDLRTQAHALFHLEFETHDEFTDCLMKDPKAAAEYERMCVEQWQKMDAELASKEE